MYIDDEKSLEVTGGVSCLGYITPPESDNDVNICREPLESTLLCYTINLSPDQWVESTLWSSKLPDEQVEYLKKVHRYVYLNIYKLLDKDDNNKVCFEFTKKGEVHSHGYFRLQEKYNGYDRNLYTILKYLKQILPSRTQKKYKYALDLKWSTDEDGWKNYMLKDINVSGFNEYVADIKLETRKLTILDFIKVVK